MAVKDSPCYCVWSNMVRRCKSDPAYWDCFVCDEWLDFRTFEQWMLSKDYQNKEIDKDILFFGNKLYSPSNCSFVDKRLNRLFRRYPDNIRSGLPRGVSKQWNRYVVTETSGGKRNTTASRFDDPMEAHFAWVDLKANLLLGIADEYDGIIKSAIQSRAIRLFDCAERRIEVQQI